MSDGLGSGDADRVDHDRLLRAGLVRGLVDGLEEGEVGARPVHAEEGDRHPALDGVRDGIVDAAEHLLVVEQERTELALADRGLDHRRAEPELEQRVHVSAEGAGETPHLRPQPRALDQLDGPPVLLRDAGEAGLDPVDAELVQEPRDLELLLGIEDDADRLLAVAQRRVVQADLAADADVVVQVSGPDRSLT